MQTTDVVMETQLIPNTGGQERFYVANQIIGSFFSIV